MTIRNILMAGVAGSVLAIAPLALAQTQTPTSPTTPQTMPQATAPAADSVEAGKLIGKSVRNPQGDKIGDIEAVYVTPGGQIDSVIVGVGGFLGIGERDVAVKWSDLTVSPDGDRVVATTTKDSLKAMPEYTWQDRTYRGKVFSDSGVVGTPERRAADATRPLTAPSPTAPSPRDSLPATGSARTDSPAADRPTMGGSPAATDRPATAPAPMRGTVKAFTKSGEMSADALIGATVKNAADETVGEIKDIHFGTDGSIKAAVVGVGGFLGVGERSVLIPWSQLEIAREGDDAAVVRTEASKDSLKAMPEYQM
ncbi:MAG: PRC-barrel domain-containing protein [Reyranellaceae bacterium]